LSVYFDASFLVALIVEDAHNDRADAYLSAGTPDPFVSDFAALEFAAVIGVRLRRGELEQAGARAALADLNAWRARSASSCELTSNDLAAADAFLRRLDLTLRAPDALHLAIAHRLGLQLASFDQRMLASAKSLGIALADL
jgi:predicted nucleic acid-binding protein